ncbi:MAG: hypothetical protein FWG81_06770 [Betaproteobacteria bacterium]|nr:hypothetical protein [Betaproteobacteria bacterium]MCL2165541.1 hypothetical protein [Oscillospiraceae bacterium]
MLKIFFLILWCFFISGCSEVNAIFLSPSEKINIAFLPKSEVRVAVDNMRALVEKDKKAAKLFEEQYAFRLDLRALNCAKNTYIGRFDTINAVREMPFDRECLHNQDLELLEFLGIQLVAARFSEPPLRPLTELGSPQKIPNIDGISVYGGVGAANAGVAVLLGTKSELVSIEIPGGNKIASLRPMSSASWWNIRLSPNGRISSIVSEYNKGITFFDNETGDKLWETPRINKVFAWLPSLSAVLAKETKSENVVLVDFKLGKITPVSAMDKNQTWGLVVQDSPCQVLIGSAREFSLVECKRADGDIVQWSTIKQFKFQKGGVTSSTPTLMFDGKAIFLVSGRDFVLFNLETGHETLWETGDFLANQYAKLSESTVLVYSFHPVNRIDTLPWVFDIAQSTLAPVETKEGNKGIIFELAGRTGFMRRESHLWFGDSLTLGEPQPLYSLLNDFILERELARLEAQADLERRRVLLDEAQIKMDNLEQLVEQTKLKQLQSRLEMQTKQEIFAAQERERVLENALNEAQANLNRTIAQHAAETDPRARRKLELELDRIARQIHELLLELHQPKDATKPLSSSTRPNVPVANQDNLLVKLSENAQIEAIGVYEGLYERDQDRREHKHGKVIIAAKASEKPIVLVLSSYEPVRWILKRDSGAKFAAIVLSGNGISKVEGAGSVRIIKSGGHYAYRTGDHKYQLLNQEVVKLTGKNINIFQGSYKAGEFSVGGR